MKQLTLIIWVAAMTCLASAQQRGIINDAESPYVVLRSIDIGDCRWTSGFWADKFKLCEEVMVPHMGTLLKGDIGHAYNETCANICNAMFSHRMLGNHGKYEYADIMELVLDNSALSGISVDG